MCGIRGLPSNDDFRGSVGGDFKKVGPDTTVNARCYSSNCRETR